jgi:glyoxalase-like protein
MQSARRWIGLGVLLAVAAVRWTVPAQARDAARPLLGGGQGVRHLVMLVREPATLVREYRDLLGFSATIAGRGGANPASYAIPFGDGTSLVISGVGERRVETGFTPLKEGQEGGAAVALDAVSLVKTAAYLQTRGIPLRSLPAPETAPAGGEAELLKGVERALYTLEPGVLGKTLFFVERSRDAREGSVRIAPQHPNTARRLASVWIAVQDVEATTKRCEAMGLSPARALRMPQLGARGQEILAGQGTILLLQPDDPDGSVAAFLKDRGEAILGASLEVTRITTARRLIMQKTRQEIDTYRGLYGRSLLIPPDLAHGLWLELFQG